MPENKSNVEVRAWALEGPRIDMLTLASFFNDSINQLFNARTRTTYQYQCRIFTCENLKKTPVEFNLVPRRRRTKKREKQTKPMNQTISAGSHFHVHKSNEFDRTKIFCSLQTRRDHKQHTPDDILEDTSTPINHHELKRKRKKWDSTPLGFPTNKQTKKINKTMMVTAS